VKSNLIDFDKELERVEIFKENRDEWEMTIEIHLF
jgi:hypothetical protein